MISKSRIKYIHGLKMKKNRTQEGCFVAEGPKLVGDLMGHFNCRYLAATAEWMQQHGGEVGSKHVEKDVVTQDELERISFLKTPQEVLAIFDMRKENTDANELAQLPTHQLCLALDDVQDPGNVGTIIRLADWFGIEHVFCSTGSADVYNPKTIQATMGALSRVQIHYVELPEFLQHAAGAPVYGTFLEGDNLYTTETKEYGIIVMGNEGNGISHAVEQEVTHKLHIPNYPPMRSTSESLNVAVATAIICAEFRRRSR
jgi:TrmH family RNA methyltransferase